MTDSPPPFSSDAVRTVLERLPAAVLHLDLRAALAAVRAGVTLVPGLVRLLGGNTAALDTLRHLPTGLLEPGEPDGFVAALDRVMTAALQAPEGGPRLPVPVRWTCILPDGQQVTLILTLTPPRTPGDAADVVALLFASLAPGMLSGAVSGERRESGGLPVPEEGGDRRFRRMFEASAIGMALIDPDGCWLEVNNALQMILQRPRETLIGQPVSDLVPPEDRAADREWLARSLAGMTGLYSREKRLLLPQGGMVWAHVTMALVRDDLGVPENFVCQIQDISQRKQAEARALTAEAQLRDAIAAMDAGFVLFDADDRLVLWNARYEEIFAPVAHLLLPGMSARDLVEIGLRHHLYQVGDEERWAERRLEDFRFGNRRAVARLSTGRWIAIKDHRTPSGGTVGIRSDITELKQRELDLMQAMEQVRLADRAKSEFLANMSHELRTPLNAILGFSEVIASEMFGPVGVERYRDYAESIHESGQHLLNVISDILDLSKIEAGELKLDRQAVDLAEVLRGCLRMVEPRGAARAIRVSTPSTAPPPLYADPLRVRQVVLNVLSNAVKFSREGGTVSVRWATDGDGGCRLEIEDHGIGMTEEEIRVAITPFGQVESAFTRGVQGTGLGLPITVKLVEAHGGTVDIHSRKDHGTTVILRFPASPSA